MATEEAKTDDEALSLSLDEQAMLELAVKANAVKRGKCTVITVQGKQWKLRPMNSKQAERWSDIDFDVKYWQKELKEATTSRKAKRLNAKIRKAFAKKAACAWLGRFWFVPGLAWLAWHYLYLQSGEVTATINTVAEIKSGDANFYFANLGCSKRQLVRCTTQVGDVYGEMQKRKQSADGMIAEDVSGEKGDSQSATPSPKRRTTTR